jgi:hypothetical protein
VSEHEALKACARLMCIRMFWLAERPCSEYEGRELCPTCLARQALASLPAGPVPDTREVIRGYIDRALAMDPPLQVHEWRSFVDGLTNPALAPLPSEPQTD